MAFDALPALADAGPYTLRFRVRSTAVGDGKLFWTTDAKTQLPQGGRVAFAVKHDGEWHQVFVTILEPRCLYAPRLDPCAGAGDVSLEGVTLCGADGAVLGTWP